MRIEFLVAFAVFLLMLAISAASDSGFQEFMRLLQ